MASELCWLTALGKTRAQRRPGACRPHGPPAEKNAGGRYHRFGSDIPALPARWFSRLYVLSLGTGCLAPIASVTHEHHPPTWPQRREARTTRFHVRHVTDRLALTRLGNTPAIASHAQRS